MVVASHEPALHSADSTAQQSEPADPVHAVLALAALAAGVTCTTPQEAGQASSVMRTAVELLRDATARERVLLHAGSFIRCAVRNLKLSLRTLALGDTPLRRASHKLAASALELLKQLALCDEMALEDALANGTLPAVARAIECEDTVMAAWQCLAACARRLQANDFQTRVAAAALWPLLERVHWLLHEATRSPAQFFCSPRLHRELVLALQFLLALSHGSDLYFRTKLLQHRIPDTLREFSGAPLQLEEGAGLELATRLQAVSRKLYHALASSSR